eukprot:3397998-Alexandrium_andersonii.AAC.1
MCIRDRQSAHALAIGARNASHLFGFATLMPDVHGQCSTVQRSKTSARKASGARGGASGSKRRAAARGEPT